MNYSMDAFQSILKQASQFQHFWKNSVLQIVQDILQDIEESARRLEKPARKLGELGWTIPIWAPVEVIPEILKNVEETRIDELSLIHIVTMTQDASKS